MSAPCVAALRIEGKIAITLNQTISIAKFIMNHKYDSYYMSHTMTSQSDLRERLLRCMQFQQGACILSETQVTSFLL